MISNEVTGTGEVMRIVSTNLDRKEDSDVSRRKQGFDPTSC